MGMGYSRDVATRAMGGVMKDYVTLAVVFGASTFYYSLSFSSYRRICSVLWLAVLFLQPLLRPSQRGQYRCKSVGMWHSCSLIDARLAVVTAWLTRGKEGR
jgi:hypothetical protein